MLKKMVFPGKYIQGAGAVGELPALIGAFGRQGLILASPTVCESVLPASGLDLAALSLPVERFGGECCEQELSKVAALIRGNNVDVLVAMGGGKAIDTAKIAADRAAIAVIVVPTIASTDAPCSGCAVLYSAEGVFERVYYQKLNPAAVLVDTATIARAPVRFLVAGMGDALSTWFEASSCHRTQSPNECGGLGTPTGLSLARLCYDTLLQYGVTAKIAAEQQLVTPALERIVEANTLLSGIGFESGGLASAHSVHNGLTALHETQETDTVYAFCEAVGLPTTLADIGLRAVDRNRLMLVAEKACAPNEGIHHEAGEIIAEKVVQAMLAASAIGEARKKRCH